ncbi:MAG: S-layer homology domain-containing protein [Peptostreptococcaceae bacterium]|nr:S-layer homology domain-containing protein [Peptostreptococcaceae bacterium]
MKRIISMVVVILMLSSGLAFAAVVPSDVSGNVYEEAIKVLSEKDIITGDVDGKFYPDSTLTRAQACIMVVKAINPPVAEVTGTEAQPINSGFADMSGYGWAEGYIGYASKMGIVNGYPDGTFKPGALVSSEEITTMVMRASGYTDVGLGGQYPSNYMEKATTLGLFDGMATVMSAPIQVTKGMTAKIIFNGLAMIEEADLQVPVGNANGTTPSAVQPIAGSRATDVNLGNGMIFTGEEMKMSLAQAKTLVMTSGAGIEMAKINLAANQAKTESYFSSYRKVREGTVVPVFGEITSSRTQKEMARLAANFALAQSTNNYNAEINVLTADAVKTYFELKQAIEAASISKGNLATQETILKNTNTKFRLGVVSKQDVLKAETSYNQASVDLAAAQSREALARISYNLNFDFFTMQNVTPTDSLAVTQISTINLNNAISLAVANRNEITAAAFSLKYKELNLIEVGNSYSKASSYYLQAQADLMLAQKNYKEMPAKMELDVRSKYMDMLNSKSSVDLGRMNADKAAETFRLAKLQYDMGMATLTDVQLAQAGLFASQLQYSQSLLKLKLAVVAYEQSTTVGTYSVIF